MPWELRRNAPIVRWAYLLAGRKPPRTSLCSLFWRTVLITPLKLMGCAGLLAMVLAAVYLYPWRIVGMFPGLGVLVCICALGSWAGRQKKVVAWQRRREDRRYEMKKPSVLIDGFRAVKAKICPIVDLVER